MLYTPVKPKDPLKWTTPDSTLASTGKKAESSFDLKSRLLQLMTENVDLKGREKVYQSRIEKLEQDAENINRQIASFLRKVNCSSLAQACQKLQFLETSPPQTNLYALREVALQLKQSLVSKNLNQYATHYYSLMINKKLQQIEQKHQNNAHNWEKESKKLKERFSETKEECMSLREENKKLIERNEKIKSQLNSSIEKYENIECIVEDKLKYYIEKMKEYEDELRRYRNEKLDFSFARDDNQDVKIVESVSKETEIGGQGQKLTILTALQTKNDPNQAQNDAMSAECYRASIEGLLEQNKRLKKSFHSLYRLKQGENVPAELQKEINIMHSILQLNELAEEITG